MFVSMAYLSKLKTELSFVRLTMLGEEKDLG